MTLFTRCLHWKNINWFLKIENMNKNGINLRSYIYLFIKFNSTFNVFLKRKKEGMKHATFWRSIASSSLANWLGLGTMIFVNVTGFYKHKNKHGQKFVPRQKKKGVETTASELVLTQKPIIQNSALQALTWFLQNIKNRSPCGKGFTKKSVTELPILQFCELCRRTIKDNTNWCI